MNECIVLVAGGPESVWPKLPKSEKKFVRWIGIDRGAWRLLKHGIIPDIAVGDFDSLSDDERSELMENVVDVVRVPPEKDLTDTELAFKIALERFPQAEKYQLIGGTGGRLDHLLANLFLVYQPCFSSLVEQFELVDRWNTVRFYRPGKYKVMKEEEKDYLTFLCMTPVDQLTLSNVKYPLTEKNFPVPISLTSNEFLDGQAVFSFTSGLVAVIQSKDPTN